jgi:hypothetical protein
MFEQRRYRAADQSLGCRRENRCRFDGQIDGRLGGYTFEKGYTLAKGYTLEKGYRLEEESYIVHSTPPPRRSEPKSPQPRL